MKRGMIGMMVNLQMSFPVSSDFNSLSRCPCSFRNLQESGKAFKKVEVKQQAGMPSDGIPACCLSIGSDYLPRLSRSMASAMARFAKATQLSPIDSAWRFISS